MTVLRQLVTKLSFDFDSKSKRDVEAYEDATDRARDETKDLRREQARLERQNRSLGKSFGNLRTSMLAMAGTFGLGATGKAVSDVGQRFDDLNNRLRVIVGADGPVDELRRALTGIAATNFQNLEDTTQIFQRFAIGTEDLGIANDELLRFTDLVQKAAAASGASAVETNNALIQFSQGLSSGELRGEEFRSVAEQLPSLLRVLKAETNLTTGQLREAAFSGQLTTDLIFQAFRNQSDLIEDQFAQLSVTRDRGLQTLQTGATVFFGSLVQGLGLNDDLGAMFQMIGHAMIGAEKAAFQFGVALKDLELIAFDAFGAIFSPFMAGGGLSFVSNFFGMIAEGAETVRRFSRIYAELRDNGLEASEAFQRALGVFFEPGQVEIIRNIGKFLKIAGTALAVLIGSNMLKGFVKLAASIFRIGKLFSPIGIAVTAVVAAFAEWNREGSVLKATFESLAGFFENRIKPVLMTIRDLFRDIISFATSAASFVVDKFTTSDEERAEQEARRSQRTDRRALRNITSAVPQVSAVDPALAGRVTNNAVTDARTIQVTMTPEEAGRMSRRLDPRAERSLNRQLDLLGSGAE